MYPSTPGEKNKLKPGSPPRGIFWTLSLLAHVTFLGWAVSFGPVRWIVFKHGEPENEILMRGDELEGLIDQLRSTLADELRARVELLQAGQQRMVVNFDTLNAHFQPFENAQVATANARFEQYATALLDGQQALLKTVTRAAATNDLDGAATAANEHMPHLISALDEVRRGIILLTKNETEAAPHMEAEEAFFLADKSLRDLGMSLSRGRYLQTEAEALAESVAVQLQKIPTFEKALLDAQLNLEQKQAEHAQAKVDLEKARAKYAGSTVREEQAALKQTTQTLGSLDRDLKQAQASAAKGRKELDGLNAAIARDRERRAGKIVEAREYLANADTSIEVGLRALESAVEKQFRAVASVRTALSEDVQ